MSLLPLIPLFPLVGAAACAILHARTLAARRRDAGAAQNERVVGAIATLAIVASFAVSVAGFFIIQHEPERRVAWIVSNWIPTGGQTIDFGFVLDPLSSVMCLVVSGVGALIHMYATGYMRGDKGYARFFTYLNLFVAAMLILVLADSLPILFIGWEGVGLCSYLLIGFWHENMKYAEAGQKAFVVNRIGDFGFLLAMFGAATWCVDAAGKGSFQFAAINESVLAGHVEPWQVTVIGLLLFVGACGKSAQLPLYVWLPDAMAGPTPVSALIHAATMVTAGVYLVIRMHPIFDASVLASSVVACVGAATALFAATMGLVARDIKKVLAYSTISQLGFLFLGAGCGAYDASFYHLVTHAFFKALLFLGAGAVILAMHHEQDLFKMGGLKRALPLEYRTMFVGAAALAGIPLMSGFFSKDEILGGVLAGRPVFGNEQINLVLYVVGAATALMTAFYTFRLIYLAFEGESRSNEHPHANPASMTIPLAALALLTIAAAALGLPSVFGEFKPLEHWLNPVLELGGESGNAAKAHGLSHSAQWLLLGASAAIAMIGYSLARATYGGGLAKSRARAEAMPGIYKTLVDRWYVDELYHAVFTKTLRLAGVVAGLFDAYVVDGAVNGVAASAKRAAAAARGLADGKLQSYSLWFGAGAVALVAAVLLLI
ncbi:MAG: NADH-quinone oxidoreductase subunit L [Planctomycetes bacterium]|nr:NADH-quinone oxidoreductase subunit L [Planctomycetota bacterium]